MDPIPVSRLEIEDVGSPRGVRLVGDIDAHTASELEAALGGFDPKSDITVDLSEVSFIDSTGLRVLVAQHQRLDESGRHLVLGNPSDAVSRLLRITGLDGTLHTG